MSDKRFIPVESCRDCPELKGCIAANFDYCQDRVPRLCPLPKWPSISRDELAKHFYGKNLKDLKDYWGDESLAGWQECNRLLDHETDWLKSIGVEIKEVSDGD